MFSFVNGKSLKNKRTAFTLLELVVVTVVIAILAAIAIPSFQGVIVRANDAKAQTTLNAIARDAQAIYRFDNGSTPLDWYNAFNEAVAETPAAANYILASESSLTLTLDLPHGTAQELADAAALAASIEGSNLALAGPSASPSQLSIYVNASNNVGMAIASTGNCVFGTVIGEEISTWSAKRDLGADCAGSIAFVDPVTVAALEVRDVSEYSNLTVPIAGTLGTPTIAPSSISFNLNFTATATAPIDSYEISRNGTVLNATVLAPLTSYTDNTAINGTSYTYSVRAQNTMGYSTSVSTSAATSYAIPEAPGFPILEAGDSSISIGWVAPSITAGAPISGYRLYRSTDAGPYLFVATITPETTLTYTDTTLTNGTPYSYQLESYGTGGNSLRSTPSSQATPITTPASVVIDSTSQASGSITVNFTTTSNAPAPVTSVTVTRNGLAYLTLDTQDGTFTDNTIIDGTSYTYTFTAHNTLFNSTPVSTTALTSYAAPAAPTFTNQTVATSEITIAWSGVTSTTGTPVTGYRIYRSVAGGGFVYLTQQLGTSLNDTGLSNGTVYAYQLTTYGTGGEGSRSASSNNLTPLSAPAEVTITTTTTPTDAITVNFTSSSTIAAPVTSITVTRNGSAFTTLLATDTTFTDNTVTNGTSYTYAITTHNAVASSAAVSTTALTSYAAPAAPTFTNATAGAGQINLAWSTITPTAAAPVSGYRLYRSVSGGAYTLLSQQTTTSYTDLAVTNGANYTYQTEAYGTGGTSVRSTATANLMPLQVALSYTSGAFSNTVSNQVLAASLTNAASDEVFSITSGSLPSGVTFNTTTGAFTGPATSAWNFLATQVSGGAGYTCALTTSGTVKCWGDNSNGGLGDGTTINRTAPVNVLGLTGVTSIATGRWHTCALLNNGGVKCWGLNGNGELGDGTLTTPRLSPAYVTGLTSGVASITAGGYHTCAVTTSGTAKCWGNNGYGQLGDATNTTRTTPVDVSGLSTGVTMISGGPWQTCAVVSGAAKCWGHNGYGQLGDTTTTDRNTPVSVSGLSSGVTYLVNGHNHACALLNTGGVKCWGDNGSGQLGDGTVIQRLTPVSVSGLTSVTSISAGIAFNCVIVSGAAKCWGDNGSGQLGDGTLSNRTTPVNVSGLTSGVTSIRPGFHHTCAVISGITKCWGNNSAGQLGEGTTTNNSLPQTVLTSAAQPGFPATLTVQATGTNGTTTANITLTAP